MLSYWDEAVALLEFEMGTLVEGLQQPGIRDRFNDVLINEQTVTGITLHYTKIVDVQVEWWTEPRVMLSKSAKHFTSLFLFLLFLPLKVCLLNAESIRFIPAWYSVPFCCKMTKPPCCLVVSSKLQRNTHSPLWENIKKWKGVFLFHF